MKCLGMKQEIHFRVRLDVDTGAANVILQKEKFYQRVQQKM